MALDSAGNVIMADNFSGTADFGGGVLNGGASINGSFYVAKFDPSGNHVWSRAFGDASAPHVPAGLGASGPGFTYVYGSYDGQIDFGGGALTSTADDIFLAKFVLP
jgi:hypothetical protein